MKTAGIIGGMGPESTIEYYRLLIADSRSRVHDGSDPSLLIASVSSGAAGSSVVSEDLFWMPVGVRWNPSSRDVMRQSVRPHLAAGLGPVIGLRSEVSDGRAGDFVGETWRTTMGGTLGGGVDVHLSRSSSLGLSGGFNWMADFDEFLAGRRNLSGFDFGVSPGWLFGRGRAPRP